MTTTSSDKTKVTLPSDTRIQIVREFDAPKRLVYRAWTEPDLVRRWITGGYGESKLFEVDLRPGGKWRHVMVMPDGQEGALHGEYTEVVPEEKLVHTEIYEAMPDAPPTIETNLFEEHDGRTTVTTYLDVVDKATRDMLLGSGMMDGMEVAYTMLEELVQSL
jgi:uncharacterized protein YndB with AHSA1/START domain